MQRLEGAVVLELTRRPFSSVAEIRGQLTPVSEAPQVAGSGFNHRRIPHLETPPEGTRRARRQAAALAEQLPPVSLTRSVSVLPPLRLSSLVFGSPTITQYVRKSREGTAYFTETPHDFCRPV